jgi:misacylated tRNA(Ala) deacylase
VPVSAVSKDSAGLVWHRCEGDWRSTRRGEGVTVHVASERRLRLMRAHTALHVVNTVMQRAHGGWITGVKIGPDRSHIDFKVDYTPDLARRVEADVNDVLSRRLPVGAGYISEEEFRERPDLLRTLEADPPIEDGRVRVVEIAGFEAQACGGTHVSDTGAVGLVRIVKVDNKGRQNRRFYIELTPGAA